MPGVRAPRTDLDAICPAPATLSCGAPARFFGHGHILVANPNIGLRELTRQIAMATRYRISESNAAELRDKICAANSSVDVGSHKEHDAPVGAATTMAMHTGATT